MEQQIDFVITWVDGQDEAWLKRKAHYTHDNEEGIDHRECRYRDWGLLRYWFRGVEKFAPWVHKIHFITEGHLPKWLNTQHPNLHIVNHVDYIPEKFLPTFSSHVLEIWMHRIEGLTEHFVYFNDDFFLIRPVTPKDFFHHGKPCDMAAFQPVVANPSDPLMSHLYLNNMLVLCKYFNKRENVRQQPWNYFHPGYPPLYFFYNLLEMAFPLYSGLYTVHGPMPFCKSTFETLWELEGELLTQVSTNRFRSKEDVTPYLFREWQKLSGNFHAKNVHRMLGYFGISEDNTKLLKAIKTQKKKVLCLNDEPLDRTKEDQVRIEIQDAFAHILPERSAFEKF